jgi:hypothetical protein
MSASRRPSARTPRVRGGDSEDGAFWVATPTSSGSCPTPKPYSDWPAPSLIEAHDEWQTTDRPYRSEATTALLTTPIPQEGVAAPERITA